VVDAGHSITRDKRTKAKRDWSSRALRARRLSGDDGQDVRGHDYQPDLPAVAAVSLT
jgi:hypothetical protein